MGKTLRSRVLRFLFISFVTTISYAASSAETCPARRAEPSAKAIMAAILDQMKSPEAKRIMQNPTGAKEFPLFRSDQINFDDWNGAIRSYFASVAFDENNANNYGASIYPVILFKADPSSSNLDGDSILAPASLFQCVVRPADIIYVSDGFTDHTAIVANVFVEQDKLELFDPWAEDSFMRSGNNVLGIEGAASITDGVRYITVSISQIKNVVRALKINNNISVDDYIAQIQVF